MLSSDVFFIVIFPLSASTASLKVKTILAFVATSVALSDGLEDDKVGASLSKFVTTKFQFVLPEDVSLSVQLNFPFVTVTVPVDHNQLCCLLGRRNLLEDSLPISKHHFLLDHLLEIQDLHLFSLLNHDCLNHLI